MLQCLKIRIKISPKAKASVRLLRKGKTYNPQYKSMWLLKKHVKELLYNTFNSLGGPLLVIMHHRLPSPKSLAPIRRLRKHLHLHFQRPDGDNLEKYLNDCLNDLIWKDDCQIAWMLRSKTITKKTTGETIL